MQENNLPFRLFYMGVRECIFIMFGGLLKEVMCFCFCFFLACIFSYVCLFVYVHLCLRFYENVLYQSLVYLNMYFLPFCLCECIYVCVCFRVSRTCLTLDKLIYINNCTYLVEG